MNNSRDFFASYLFTLATYSLTWANINAFKSDSNKINFYFLWY